MQVGDYIRVKGKIPDWLDIQQGNTFPDYNALVIELWPQPSIFKCCIMKSDGTLWNIGNKQIIHKRTT
jgi:hypothetical protein